MVEGGAKIIQSFLKSGLVDLLVVTIAPVYVVRGISVVDEENQEKGRVDSPSKVGILKTNELSSNEW